MLEFTGNGRERYDARLKRAFVATATEQKLKKAVDECEEVYEVEDIVLANNLCDYCDFKALNIKVVSMLVKTITHLLYQFPRARSKVCYLGSKAGYLDMMYKMRATDRGVLAKLGIGDMMTDESIISVAASGIEAIEGIDYNGKDTNILAQVFDMCGLIDAVILDEADFSGFGYMRFCNELKENVNHGYHPPYCSGTDYVIYHEFGHTLDRLCGITDSAEFARYYSGLTADRIRTGVSEYAATNAQECFAEAFAEYMCSPAPREIALYLSNLLKRKY